MAIPNYSPEGEILFGSVPWDNGYTNVRLYTSLDEQYNDIASMMKLKSSDYVYVGRNRRLKVSIDSDRLYHCNYCMYRNSSITDGYIYCFIRDVKYIGSGTSEITLETDIFNTYLYGVDWQIPSCFIERETTPTEDDRYMLTNEPDFPLVYTVDGKTGRQFINGGFIVMTTGQPEQNQTLVDDVINPNGYYAKPAPVKIVYGIPSGASLYYCDVDTSSGNSEALESFLNRLTYAGSIESVVAVFSIPDFARPSGAASGQFIELPHTPDLVINAQAAFKAPGRGTSLNGYTPRNRKLLYYPYNFIKLTDFNGSTSELRFELMGSDNINIKYVIHPACQALVYPETYMGIDGFDAGIVVNCGSQGSWSNNMFQTWLSQNAGTIAMTLAGIAIAGAAGATTIGAASKTLSEAGSLVGAAHINEASLATLTTGAMNNIGVGANLMKGAGVAAGLGYQQLSTASKQPTMSRGQVNYDTMYATGVQGAYAERVVVKSEVAQQIDQFFDRWGYAVERIEQVNITSRPAWNYVKTGGSSPKSMNVQAGSTAPFTRGRGTPAEALSVIRRAFDSGITFWHTTSGFGDYSQSNGI